MLPWCQSTVRATLSSSNGITSRVQLEPRHPARILAHAVLRMEGTTCRTPKSMRSVGKSMLAPRDTSPSVVDMFGRRYLSSTRNTPARVSRSTSKSIARKESRTLRLRTRRDTRSVELIILMKFLCPKTQSSPQPVKLSTDTLQSLYTTIKRQSELCHLTAKNFTEILSIMGSLSLPAPRAPCIYLSKLLSHVIETSSQMHWAFVMEIARDKEKLSHALSGTDRYWIMRAKLARVVVAEGEKLGSSDPRFYILAEANVQYLRIWRHPSDPEIHLPYFHTLLSLSLYSPEHSFELVRLLCKVLVRHANPHSRFLDIVCQVLIGHGHVLQVKQKAQLLDMVSTRLSKFNSDGSVRKKNPSPTVKRSEKVSKSYKPSAVGISDLASILGAAIFPCHSLTVRPLPLVVHQWSVAQATNIFAPTVPLDTRWHNLLVLAMSKMPHVPAHEVSPPASQYSDKSVVNWQVVFVLATLKQALSDVSPLPGSPSHQGILNVIRPLWRMWKAVKVHAIDRPIMVTRAMVAGFLSVSTLALDAPLKDGCWRFCVDKQLFIVRDSDSDADKLQTNDLVVAYILAEVSFQGKRWPNIFSKLIRVTPDLYWRNDVTATLLRHYISRDPEAALGLYRYSKNNDIQLSPEVVHAIGIGLATPRTWQVAAPFLDHPQFSQNQVQTLLGAILRVFQIECREYADPALVGNLGQAMLKLYTDQPPLQRYKYAVRFFLPIMIVTGHAMKAVHVAEAIHRQMPSFFNTKSFLRLMRSLARFRHLRLTSRLYCLVSNNSTRSVDDLRRKVTLDLASAGASACARNVYRTGIRRKGWRTARESMARAVGFRTQAPSPLHALRVVHILARNPSHGPTIKYAVSILVRARHLYTAIGLLGRTYQILDPATRTSICNTILHGRLLCLDVGNVRRLRSVLRTKELLENNFAFTPDRTSINIILKAILQCQKMMDPPKLKKLFDHMVRMGYPASPRWCTQSDVPFGTQASSPPENLNLLNLSSTISFERHVRPMYKMFIKAFYVRHDVSAAKLIVGILKEEEVLAMRKREERNRIRRQGLMKKQGRAEVEV